VEPKPWYNITAFRGVRHLPISRVKLIHSTSPLSIRFNIILQSALRYSKRSLCLRFSHQIFMIVFPHPQTCHMSRPSHFSWIGQPYSMRLVPVAWCSRRRNFHRDRCQNLAISRNLRDLGDLKGEAPSPAINTVPYLPHLLVHYGSFSVTNQSVTTRGVLTSRYVTQHSIQQGAPDRFLLCWEESGSNLGRYSRPASRFPLFSSGPVAVFWIDSSVRS